MTDIAELPEDRFFEPHTVSARGLIEHFDQEHVREMIRDIMWTVRFFMPDDTLAKKHARVDVVRKDRNRFLVRYGDSVEKLKDLK